jgi:HTH-type transcriptional regulator/antitoxin HigA
MEKGILIVTGENYHKSMMDIYELMNKGETNLTTKELEQLRIMAIAAEKYEDEILHLRPVE